jgi:hypothetical protein
MITFNEYNFNLFYFINRNIFIYLDILLSINQTQYEKMFSEYEKIKHMFELEYMCEYICGSTIEPIPEATIGIGKGFIESDNDVINITF